MGVCAASTSPSKRASSSPSWARRGAGKSSLLNVLALLDDQWAGEYWFGEQPVHLMKRKDRAELAKRKIGMVFQSYHLLDDLTVQENIDLPLSYKDIPRSQRQGMVADTLDHFQIVAKKDLYPNQLSGGQQQLVGIARAVIHKPALLLADEPTGNLHSSQAQEIMEMFAKLNQRGHDHRAGHALGGERFVRIANHSDEGWMAGKRHRQSGAGAGRGGGAFMTTLRSQSPKALGAAPQARPSFSSMLVDARRAGATTADAADVRAASASSAATADSECAYAATGAGQASTTLSPPPPLVIRTPPNLAMPHSNNPIDAYKPRRCRSRLSRTRNASISTIRDGKLYISLQDAIDLALENNLDLAIARYNLPIADTDILRTKAGGIVSRRQHRYRAGHAGRRRRRIWRRRSGRWRRRYDGRRGWCGRRRIGSGAVHPRSR